jgi:hypothetical protein
MYSSGSEYGPLAGLARTLTKRRVTHKAGKLLARCQLLKDSVDWSLLVIVTVASCLFISVCRSFRTSLSSSRFLSWFFLPAFTTPAFLSNTLTLFRSFFFFYSSVV